MTFEKITHAAKTWPSGLVTFNDRVHSEADRIDRQELTIKGAIDAGGEFPIYAYLPSQEEWDMDPWRYLEGIDPWIDGETIDIWFESGACKTVKIDDCRIRFFIDKKNA